MCGKEGKERHMKEGDEVKSVCSWSGVKKSGQKVRLLFSARLRPDTAN